MVDDEFFAACDIDVALSLGLQKGMVLTDELIDRLRKEDRSISLKQKLWKYCTYKPRTEKQARNRCEELEASEMETTEILAWLTSFGQIDDEAYAQRFTEAASTRKPMSSLAIRKRLTSKGLSPAVIDKALANHSDKDEEDAAVKVAERKLRTKASTPPSREQLTRFLASRGYSYRVVRLVVAQLLPMLMLLGVTAHVAVTQSLPSCNRERLPPAINQWQPTTVPVILDDENTLFVDRKYHPDNEGGTSDPDDAWVSKRDSSGNWSEALHEDFTLGISRPDVVFAFSYDALRALVAGPYGPNKQLRFALLKRTSPLNPFTSADIIHPQGMGDIRGRYFATMSDDARHCIVAIEQPGGFGDLDLYHTAYCKGQWSPLVNLGKNLNTSSFDGAPFLARDGVTLYFSSAGREPRRGLSDIYVVRRLGPSWKLWTSPQWLGPCVNTPGDESAISLPSSAERAYVASWDEESQQQGLYVVDIADSVKPGTWCGLTLDVRDAQTSEPILNAVLQVSDTEWEQCVGSISSSTQGGIKLALSDDTRYQLLVLAPGYAAMRQLLHIQSLDSVTSLHLTVRLFPLNKPLATLYFERGSALLSDADRASLRALVDSTRSRGIGFKVTGYTDELGSRPFNQTLSAQRASAVTAELTDLGIPVERLSAEGKGVEIPKVSPLMRENPQSRRVDVFAVAPVETTSESNVTPGVLRRRESAPRPR